MAEQRNHRGGDLGMLTLAKLIAICAALLTVTTFVQRQIVVSEINALRAELANTYAPAASTLSRAEYEARRDATNQQLNELQARVVGLERERATSPRR